MSFKDNTNETQEITNKEKFYFVLAYVPFVNISLLFLDTPKLKDLSKHISLGITLFGVYIILYILGGFLDIEGLFTLLYVGTVLFFGAKAYNGEYIEVEFLEKIISNFTSKK